MYLYVSNLSIHVQDKDVKGLFIAYGEVHSAGIIIDKTSGRSRSFGFLEKSCNITARKAVTELNQTTRNGRHARGMGARPKEERSFRGKNGGGYKKSR